ncbi:hypothetical protein FKM82_002552 [Ascaphus truei]
MYCDMGSCSRSERTWPHPPLVIAPGHPTRLATPPPSAHHSSLQTANRGAVSYTRRRQTRQPCGRVQRGLSLRCQYFAVTCFCIPAAPYISLRRSLLFCQNSSMISNVSPTLFLELSDPSVTQSPSLSELGQHIPLGPFHFSWIYCLCYFL